MGLSAEELQLLKELHAEEQDYQKSKVSAIESTARGFGQSATLGFADEAEAGVRAALDPDKEYSDYIGKIRGEYDTADKAHPYWTKAGELGGAFVPGLGIAKGAGLVGKGAQAALRTLPGLAATGAAEGALTGLGVSEDKGVSDAVMGGLAGGVLGYGGGKLAQKLKGGAGKVAEEVVEGAGATGDDAARLASTSEEVFGAPSRRKDADQVSSAWKSLTGEDAPPMALTKDRETHRLWSDVLESPSMAGAAERKSLKPAMEGVEGVASKIEQASGRVTAEDAGTQVRSILSQSFDQSMEPIEEGYKFLEKEFDDIPVSKSRVKAMLTGLDNQIARLDPSGKSKQMIENIRSTLEGVEDVSDLRQFRTNLRKSYDWGSLTDNEKGVLKGVYDNITKVRNNSISKVIFTNAGEAGVREGIPGADRLKQLLQLDNQYAQTMNKFSGMLGLEGRKGLSMKGQIQEYLSDATPLEQYMKDLFDKGDITRLKAIQKSNPELFEVLRKRALAESVEKATSRLTGRAEPNAVLGQVGGMKRPEVRNLVLGDLQPQFEAAQTVNSALPQSFNPSQTATKLGDYNIFSPSAVARQAEMGVKRNLLRSGKTMPSDVSQVFQKSFSPKVIIQRLMSSPEGGRFTPILQQASERGDASFATTYFLLSQSDPKFREAVNAGEGTGN